MKSDIISFIVPMYNELDDVLWDIQNLSLITSNMGCNKF